MLAKAILAASLAWASSASANSCDSVFTAAFEPGRTLEMDLRSGDVEIFGTPESEIRVVCRLDDPTRAHEVRVGFSGKRLTISGGPNKGVRYRIYVPQRTNLDLECSAGNVTLHDVNGDKDLSLRAGNLTVNGTRPEDYSRLEASVTAGNVNAPKFGGEKSGLFRSFKKNNSGGKYRLKAHVSAGNITIR